MTSISHTQARSLIQAKSDQLLTPDQRASLVDHLSACEECRSYAEELTEVERFLRTTLHARWNTAILPLSIKEIIHPTKVGTLNPRSLKAAGRMVIVPAIATILVSLMLIITFWFLPTAGTPALQTLSVTAPLVPVQSAEQTATRLILPECDALTYEVQEDDTLDSIAQKFSISKELLIAYNGLTRDLVHAHTQLLIPVCHSTPLAGSKTPAFTITSTPQAEFTIHTP